MKHLSEEQLTMAYYGDSDPDARNHLDECAECRAALARIERLLNEFHEYPAPEPHDGWEAQVWARLQPHLPARKPRRIWFQWYVLAPAMAALLVVAFLAGMWKQKKSDIVLTANARERVLLVAMGDHLDRSEMVMAELVNAAPGETDLSGESARARDLLNENRLLRQTALRTGDVRHAALLDELERVLLDIAHTSPEASAGELQALQRRIESEGLLFRLRIVSSNIHEKGKQL
ncbi:MAG TPA: hypothetical protein VFA04_08630 [Bryobacteraceae bacterium]|nr:hypothetical protein [Bryobacteraceae bacterium]